MDEGLKIQIHHFWQLAETDKEESERFFHTVLWPQFEDAIKDSNADFFKEVADLVASKRRNQ